MITALAGLPGVGKTTLAEQLTSRFPAALFLRKDAVRHALFGTEHATFTRDQDDHCVQVLFATAVWQWLRAPATTVVLDGRPGWLPAGSRTCARLRRDALATPAAARMRLPGRHRSRSTDHRSPAQPSPSGQPHRQLRQELAATAVPITGPKLLLDTGKPVGSNLDIVLRHLDVLTALAGLRPTRALWLQVPPFVAARRWRCC